MILKRYDPQIYPRKVWVCFDPDFNKLNKKFEIYNYPDAKIQIGRDGTEAFVQPVVDRKTNNIGILVTFVAEVTPQMAAHEAVHVADWIFDEVEAFTQGYDEADHPFVYLVGWVVKCIYECLNQKLTLWQGQDVKGLRNPPSRRPTKVATT